jgi:hypothetical protein
LQANLQAAASSIVRSGASPAGGRLYGRAISTIAKRDFGVRFLTSDAIGAMRSGTAQSVIVVSTTVNHPPDRDRTARGRVPRAVVAKENLK